jgi:deoxyribodipyrimidine photolyase
MTKKQTEDFIKSFIKENIIHEYNDMPEDIAYSFLSKALEAGEISSLQNIDDWYEDRFKPNLFVIGENEYTKATIEALKIQFSIAGTDFGSSRQRDLGQKWSDTIRGT